MTLVGIRARSVFLDSIRRRLTLGAVPDRVSSRNSEPWLPSKSSSLMFLKNLNSSTDRPLSAMYF